jgi:hypothetical protein
MLGREHWNDANAQSWFELLNRFPKNNGPYENEHPRSLLQIYNLHSNADKVKR